MSLRRKSGSTRLRLLCLLGLSMLAVNPRLLGARQLISLPTSRPPKARHYSDPHHYQRWLGHVTPLELGSVRVWEGSYSLKYVNNSTAKSGSGPNRYTKTEVVQGYAAFRRARAWWLRPAKLRMPTPYYGKAREWARYAASEVSSESCNGWSIKAYGRTPSVYAELSIGPKSYTWFVNEFTTKSVVSHTDCSSHRAKKEDVGFFVAGQSLGLPRVSPVLCGTLDISWIGGLQSDHHLSLQWMFYPKGEKGKFVPDCVHVVKVKRE